MNDWQVSGRYSISSVITRERDHVCDFKNRWKQIKTLSSCRFRLANPSHQWLNPFSCLLFTILRLGRIWHGGIYDVSKRPCLQPPGLGCITSIGKPRRNENVLNVNPFWCLVSWDETMRPEIFYLRFTRLIVDGPIASRGACHNSHSQAV